MGNTSGCLVIFSKRNIKGERQDNKLHNAPAHSVDRTFVLPSGKTSLTSRKSSA